jgi:hypothetical protein
MNEIDIKFDNNTLTVAALGAIGTYFVCNNKLPQASLVLCIALLLVNIPPAQSLPATVSAQGSAIDYTLPPGRESNITPVHSGTDDSINEFLQQTDQPMPILPIIIPEKKPMDDGLHLISKSIFDRQFIKTPYQQYQPVISADISDIKKKSEVPPNLKQRNEAIDSFNRRYSKPESRQAYGLPLIKLLAGAYEDPEDAQL